MSALSKVDWISLYQIAGLAAVARVAHLPDIRFSFSSDTTAKEELTPLTRGAIAVHQDSVRSAIARQAVVRAVRNTTWEGMCARTRHQFPLQGFLKNIKAVLSTRLGTN